MSISNRVSTTTVTALRLIVWGGLICVFDVTFRGTFNGEGWKIDIINDLVGMLMITWSVYQLCKIRLHDRYRTAMVFVTILAMFSCLDEFHRHFIDDTPPLVSFFHSVLGVLAMAAAVVFCVAMRWLCSETGLQSSERSWRTTTVLFVLIYLIPLGLCYCASAIAIATRTSFNINLGPVGLLLLPIGCIPLIHLFVSTSRMKVDANSIINIGQQGATLVGIPLRSIPASELSVGTQKMTEETNRFSPEYRKSIRLILIEQIPLGLLAGMIIDGVGVAMIFLYALASYWAGFGMIVLRRPMNPTKTDLFVIKWGTFALFAICFAMASVTWRWRGAI